MVRTKRPDAHKGAVNVTVKPIADRNQVLVNINDHFEFAATGAETAIDLLEAEFSNSNLRALDLAVKLLEASWARA